MAKAKKLSSGNWRTLIYDHTDENGKGTTNHSLPTQKRKVNTLQPNTFLTKMNARMIRATALLVRFYLNTLIPNEQHCPQQQSMDMNVHTKIIIRLFLTCL